MPYQQEKLHIKYEMNAVIFELLLFVYHTEKVYSDTFNHEFIFLYPLLFSIYTTI